MSTLNLETEVGGPPVQVNVLVLGGPGGHTPEDGPALAVFSDNPSCATVALHPTRTRSVIVTPGFVGGAATVTVSCDPPADENLVVTVTNLVPPPLRRIVPDPERPSQPVE